MTVSNLRTQQEFRQRQVLKEAGWSVSQTDSIEFNAGSESYEHFVTKSIVAYEMKNRGFRVASEVEGPGGEIDLVFYGTEDHPLAIEVEKDITEEIIQDKLERYVYDEPFRDMITIDVDELPDDLQKAREWVQNQL